MLSTLPGTSTPSYSVMSTFREPSLGHHVHHELLRSVLLDLTPIITNGVSFLKPI